MRPILIAGLAGALTIAACTRLAAAAPQDLGPEEPAEYNVLIFDNFGTDTSVEALSEFVGTECSHIASEVNPPCMILNGTAAKAVEQALKRGREAEALINALMRNAKKEI